MIGLSPLFVGIFLAGSIDEPSSLYQFASEGVIEEAFEVWIFEGVVVGQRDLVEMIRIDELLPMGMG